jgi:hypothetical protein
MLAIERLAVVSNVESFCREASVDDGRNEVGIEPQTQLPRHPRSLDAYAFRSDLDAYGSLAEIGGVPVPDLRDVNSVCTDSDKVDLVRTKGGVLRVVEVRKEYPVFAGTLEVGAQAF